MLLSPDEWAATRLSLQVAFTAVTLSLPLGIAAGWLLGRRNFRGKLLFEVILNLPLVMPPVVTGYLLLVLFGRRGPLGPLLASLGIHVVFDWKGAALASAVMAFPLMVRAIRIAI